MGILLDVLYALAGLIALPFFLFKALTDRRYRHHLRERFGRAPLREGEGPCLWIHCASVGEVALIKPLLKELSRRRPDLAINLSIVTKAGRKAARKAYPKLPVHYWPVDFSFAVRRAIRRVRPTAIVLVELEVWPNFVRSAEKLGVPVVVINGRMSTRSHRRYRRFAWFFRSAFRRLARVAAQTQATADRLAELGVPAARLSVSGNLKYDAGVDLDVDAARRELRALWGIGPGDSVLVGGSTHDPEERILVEAWKKLRLPHDGLRLLIAPRHLERAPDLAAMIEAMGLRVVRRSTLAGAPPADAVLLLDTVGELARTYAMADVVFIGGTFCDRGGQNMLEPAALAKPVLSGPSLENFREIADDLVEAGGMKVLKDSAKLVRAIDELLLEPARGREMGEKGRAVAGKGRGAVTKTADLLLEVLGR